MTVHVSPKLHRRLKLKAAEMGISIEDLAQQIIVYGIDRVNKGGACPAN